MILLKVTLQRRVSASGHFLRRTLLENRECLLFHLRQNFSAVGTHIDFKISALSNAVDACPPLARLTVKVVLGVSGTCISLKAAMARP